MLRRLRTQEKPRDREASRGTATGIRTPVSAVRGRRPSPLDDSGTGTAQPRAATGGGSAAERTRTPTSISTRRPERRASTNSATAAELETLAALSGSAARRRPARRLDGVQEIVQRAGLS